MRSNRIPKGLSSKESAKPGLGDKRLDERYQAMAAVAACKPDASFPQMFSTHADVEAAYRFFRNERVEFTRLLRVHVERTRERIRGLPRVIVAHDSSEFSFPGDSEREGLGYLKDDHQGFLGHFSLAVTADNNRIPLGVLNVELIVRKKPEKKLTRAELRAKTGKESERWVRGILAAEKEIGATEAIHVMDREFDGYRALSQVVEPGIKFVARSRFDRIVSDGRLFETIRQAEGKTSRLVHLTRRRQDRSMRGRKLHPERPERMAHLEFSAETVRLQRPTHEAKGCPEELDVNVVRVFEPSPPEGVEAIEWILLTNLPIATAKNIEEIVDAYVARWMIEEYFKALKTGCDYEGRQLESLQTLTVALGLLIPIAWQLLFIRALSRIETDVPAMKALTHLQLKLLIAMSEYKLSEHSTAIEIYYAIARLGGHLKQNGPPGWQTLGRGFQRLNEAQEVFLLTRDVIND